jgi:hypothetical protein
MNCAVGLWEGKKEKKRALILSALPHSHMHVSVTPPPQRKRLTIP